MQDDLLSNQIINNLQHVGSFGLKLTIHSKTIYWKFRKLIPPNSELYHGIRIEERTMSKQFISIVLLSLFAINRKRFMSKLLN
jgi:hypothetical protein